MGTQQPRVDDYIERAAPFAQPILAHIRGLWHQACPDILEEIKWGAPHFTHKGIVGAMAGFKQHVSMGFWNRKLLSDPEGLFKDTDCTHLSAIKAGSVGELPDDRILLDLVINQDSVGELVPSGNGGLIPSIDTTELTTQVLVGNGETVVLGGVFRTEDLESISKVPFFGDIPYVGAFFRNEAVTRTKTETLIFITPRILADTLLD